MNFLQKLLTFFDYAQKDNLEKENFQNLPYLFYCKDLKERFIDSNDFHAQQGGRNKAADILGDTDFDLPWASCAHAFVENDQEVILTEKPKMVVEPIIIFNGNRHNALSYKTPLRAGTGKIIGIKGITVLLDAESSCPDHYQLSKRQEECLFLLVRGKTTKEIAQTLRLSPRTVESYINEIKIKMSCSSKSQIIEKVFNEEMVSMLLKGFTKAPFHRR